MHFLSLFLAAVATAHASYIVPAPVVTGEIPPIPTLFKRQANQDPCQEIAQSWSAAKPKATDSNIYVHAKTAYDCLQSVPVDVEGDIKLIDEMKLFMEFQTDLSYLKQGIKTHNAEPLDIMGGLDDISQSIKNGTEKSEYSVQQRIRFLLLKAGDFHFHWTADIQTPLVFARYVLEVTSSEVLLTRTELIRTLCNGVRTVSLSLKSTSTLISSLQRRLTSPHRL